MGNPPDEQPSCFVCNGTLTAVGPQGNFVNVLSFSRTWICDSCGARYSEDVEVEKAPATDEETTDASTQEVNDDQSETETKMDSSSESDSQSTGEWQAFETDSDHDRSELRKQWEQEKAREAKQNRRVLDDAKEMPVDWHAPFGTVLDQTDQFVVAQTLYKNRFALLDIRTGDLITEVELVRDQSERPTGDQNEWDGDKIPDDVELYPSGTFELDKRPGWDPIAGVHWCVGSNALYVFDTRGVSRYPGSNSGLTWTVEVPTEGASKESRCCAFLDGALFVATPDEVCAIQADTGEISWRYELSDGDANDLRLLLHPETLYLSERSEIVSIDVDTGAENWTREVSDVHRDQTVRQFVSIEEDILVTVEESDTNYICGYDVASGKRQWTFQDRHRLSILRTQDGAVYVDGHDGVVFCLNAATGLLRWQHQFKKLVKENAKTRSRADRGSIEFLTVTDQGIVTANWSGAVYLLDLETGNKQWRNFPEGELPSDTGPKAACRVVGDAMVRIKDTDVKALDLSSGEERWSFETTEMVPTNTSWFEPAVEDDLLYFTDYDGTLYEVGAKANGLQRLCQSEDGDYRSFAVDAEHIYVAPLQPGADIPAYRIAQEAVTEQTDSKRSTDSLQILQALLR